MSKILKLKKLPEFEENQTYFSTILNTNEFLKINCRANYNRFLVFNGQDDMENYF